MKLFEPRRNHGRRRPAIRTAFLLGMTLAIAPAIPAGEAEFDADGFNLYAPAGGSEETRRALEPVEAIRQAPPPVVRTGPETAEAAAGGIVISPPSANMPVAYYDLPLHDLPPLEEGIPGVLLPEIDESFQEPRPYARGSALAAKARTGGMSIRQLEPFFALAKGSEGRALEAKRDGDLSVYEDQIGKSIAAYMDIIAMADAGNEAREEAWYGVARCEYRRQNWWRAFEALERSFPRSFAPDEVAGRVRLETFIGERLWRLGNDDAPDAVVEEQRLSGYQAAARVYAAVVFNQPSADDAPLALLRRGDAAALDGGYAEAAKFYRQLITYYPDNEHAMQARSSLAEAIYRQEWPVGLPEAARSDVQSIMADVERTGSVLSGEAAARRRRAIAVANDLEAATKLRHAKEYLTSMRGRKSRDGAIFLLKDVASMYPDAPEAAEARELLLSLGVQPPEPLAAPVSPFAFHDPLTQPAGEGVEGGSHITLDVPGSNDF